MDALAALLAGPRARGAFLLRSVMSPPWSVRVLDQAPLSLVAMARGQAWLMPDDGRPVPVRPGDVAVMRGPAPYTFADDPATPPQVTIHPGGRCRTPDGRDLAQAMDLGVRTWGNDPNGSVVMLIGTYQLHGEVSQRLLGVLPGHLVLSADSSPDQVRALVALLAGEVVAGEPGQEVVLDRLLDALLVAVLRAWFARPGQAPAWYRAYADPVVGPAVRMLHHHPAHPWTVASLAARVGVSRAGLARRFTALIGEPPMTFLSRWRLDLAADLLGDGDLTLDAVARRVGYGSGFALSAAFKRAHGMSPQQYRAGLWSGRGRGGEDTVGQRQHPARQQDRDRKSVV